MPDLIQTLEPNQRGVAVYKDGEFLGYEDIVTLPDEIVHREELDDEFNSKHVTVLQAVNNWEKVKPEQKDELLRYLARFYLYVMKKSFSVETGL